MPKLELLQETTSQICHDIFKGQQFNVPDFIRLKELLSTKIQQLLSSNINQLLNILYRLDVSEPKVKQAFKLITEEEIADQLAILIIHRVKQKIEIRNNYSEK
jgi:hypothetical protein